MTGRYEISSERWAMIEAIVSLLNTWGAQGAMTVRCLTESSGFCALAPNGGIFQNASGLGRPFTSVSGSGVITARLSRLCATCTFVCGKTVSSIWIPGGSIPRQFEPPELPAVLEKKGPAGTATPLSRPQPRRTDHQHTPRLRQPWLPAGHPAVARRTGGLALLHAVAGSDQPSWQQGSPAQALPDVLADKGYDSQVLRQSCDRYGMQPIIPLRKMHRKPRPGLPRLFDKPQYKKRNVIERLFSRLKEKRRLYTRYDKLASSFKAMVTLACIEKCLRADFSDKP